MAQAPLKEFASLGKPWSPWLDYARVLATVLIIVFHLPSSAFASAPKALFLSDLLSFFGSAGGALAFFFLLSGFLTNPGLSWQKWVQKVLLLLLPFITWNLLCSIGVKDPLSLSRIFGIGHSLGLCADYPLWFVRDLLFLLLLLPLYRQMILPLLVTCAIMTYWWDNTWPLAWLRDIPLPKPANWVWFLSGLAARRIHAAAWQRLFYYTAPVWWGLSGLHLLHLVSLSSAALPIQCFCILSTGAVAEKLPSRCHPLVR